MFIGPDAHIHCWLGAMMKLLERTFTVKEMKGGAIQTILCFNSLAISVCSYIASLTNPPSSAKSMEARGIALAFSTPMWALPTHFLRAAKHHFRFCLAPRDIEFMAQASQYHVATRCSGLRTTEFWLSEDNLSDEDLFLFQPFPDWKARSIHLTLLTTKYTVENLNITVVDTNTRPQRTVHQALLKSISCRDFADKKNRERLMHFDASFAAIAVCFRELLAKCGLPDHVKFVMIKTVCNAWPTSWRYGTRGCPCRFLCGIEDDDSILSPPVPNAGSSSVISQGASPAVGAVLPPAVSAGPDLPVLDEDDSIASLRDRCSDSIWHYSTCRIIERDLSRVLPSAVYIARLLYIIFRYYFFLHV